MLLTLNLATFLGQSIEYTDGYISTKLLYIPRLDVWMFTYYDGKDCDDKEEE